MATSRSRENFVVAACVLLATTVLVVGWRQMWFLTDDAFISFRYVSNSLLGHGYVWNPEPFRPVEGYTNFLWVVVLEAVWRVTGVAPPQSANPLSLLFSVATLSMTARMLWRIDLRPELRRHRLLLLALTLAGLVTHRTFVTWTSSGLETAMFNCWVTSWIYGAVFVRESSRLRGPCLAITAALAYLTRPDGLLLVGATLVLFALASLPDAVVRARLLTASIPLAVVPAHVIWRYSTYHEWLPNTYHAKVTGIWPQSGVRYLASFVLEYGLWWWWLPLGLLVWRVVTGRVQKPAGSCSIAVAAGVLLLHVGYYVLVVGGDHFEYRVLSHTVPFILLSFVWLLDRASVKPLPAVAAVAVLVLLSWPVAWTHWAKSRQLTTRSETFKLRVSLVESWPTGLRWYARTFDSLQFWLIDHFVCVRHQEHKVNLQFIRSLFPPRAEGEAIASSEYPVIAFPAVGYVAWALPHVNVIDLHGLNDHVIARIPPDPDEPRMMAHERRVPPGYVECFRPDLRLDRTRGLVVEPRVQALTAAEIRDCEDRWAEGVP